MRKFLFLFLCLSGLSGFSQTLEDVDALQKEYQACLDLEENIEDCAIDYYTNANKLLDIVFKNARGISNAEKKSKLKKEQLLWINKKNAYFTKVYNETRDELGTEEGADFTMVVKTKRADFIAERIVEILKQE